MGDLNGYHQEWLDATTMNRHGVAAVDFATVSDCDQLVIGPIHARGGTLDLLMIDVRNLVRVAVVALIGNCRRSFRWLRLFQSCEFVGNFFLNIKSNGRQFGVQYRIFPGVMFGLQTFCSD